VSELILMETKESQFPMFLFFHLTLKGFEDFLFYQLGWNEVQEFHNERTVLLLFLMNEIIFYDMNLKQKLFWMVLSVQKNE